MVERRYVVIGGGAVGGALAAHLVPAGHEVVLVARGEHGKRIAADGLRVRRPAGTETVDVPVAAGPDDLELRAGDVLLLTVKTQDAETALAQWAWQPVTGATGGEDGSTAATAATALPILTFQNGLATEDLALRRFRRVYGAVAAIAAGYVTPGEIVSPSVDPAGLFWIGRHPGGSDELQESIVADLRGAGFAAFSVTDIGAQKAAKLLGNLSQNGLALLEGSAEERGRAEQALREEAVAVFAAAGVALPPGGALDRHGVTLQVGDVPGYRSLGSTWQSFARGTSSEIDYLNGEVVLLARRAGVPAPLSERLQELLGSAELADRRTVAALLAAADSR
ncbi:2-dehydropantoate 2-reductase N-terminal domain-containing protein [Nocardioides sp. BP30]|uniref:ketopantoate reductase family protein n=1 Tax=Nocardioides sp. BP30 TaxID=3036374 RepID=UPI002469168F|nr:2-dehydropantoate 2-reductase N-terminal domain-containing protein [Nocardioides sp. BP30]WGL52033.1 2-dehydropantoate 2-reductase N-terminal domain-containing protein [Nocardioides sp. BP30]